MAGEREADGVGYVTQRDGIAGASERQRQYADPRQQGAQTGARDDDPRQRQAVALGPHA